MPDWTWRPLLPDRSARAPRGVTPTLLVLRGGAAYPAAGSSNTKIQIARVMPLSS